MQMDEKDTAEMAGSMASESTFNRMKETPHFLGLYREDVVQSLTRPGVLGIITRVAGESDSDSSSESDEEEEGKGEGGQGDTGSLLQGCAQVYWMDSEETTEKIDGIQVVDRPFTHGDIVAQVAFPLGQTGTVVNIELLVDLKLPGGGGRLLKNVDSRKLKHARPLALGDYVIRDCWLGRVNEVSDDVTVMFNDGSKCKIVGADPTRLIPLPEGPLTEDEQDYSDDLDYSYYQGQRVKATSPALFKTARWLRGSWKPKRVKGVVTNVEVGSVVVYWIAAGHTGTTGPQPITIPSERQDPKDLKPIMYLSYTNWKLGDHALLPKRCAQKGGYTHTETSEVVMEKGEDSTSNEEEDSTSEKVEASTCEKGEFNTSEKGEASPSEKGAASTRKKGSNTSEEGESTTSKKGEASTSEEGEASTSEKGKVSTSDEKVEACVPELESKCGFGTKFAQLDGLALHHKKLRHRITKHEMRANKKKGGGAAECAFLVVNTRTKVDVAWQDGTCKRGISACDLFAIDHLGDHDFWPGQYVQERSSEIEGSGSETQRVGFVKRVDAKQRTASVQWLKQLEGPVEEWQFENEEVVSVYELEQHPHYSYSLADVVVRLCSISEVSKAQNGSWPDNSETLLMTGVANNPENGIETEPVSSTESRGGKKFKTKVQCSGLSWVGVIIGLQDGDIEVAWADGSVSKVGPWEINVVGGDEGDGSTQSSDIEDGDDDARSWETVDSLDALEAGTIQEDLIQCYSNEGEEKEDSAVDKLTGVDNEEQEWKKTQELSGLSKVSDSSEATLIKVVHNEVEENDDDGENDYIESSDKVETSLSNHPYEFKHFDAVKDALDHHFLIEDGQPTNQRKWSKKIQQEWGILEKSLPDTVYVRVYEDRMDLLRSVIVGAAGTPYHDGLFVFDICLPPEYPSAPPLVHYHSGGLRLNPNLYESGKVCLSLLNTWNGKGTEIWHPSSSSILQVLVSIQGLVLNAKPYFNEAGYDKQIGSMEGEKNSLAYSENSFLLSCKTMLYLLRRPPKHFEGLVREHFKLRGPFILRACNAYMQGAPVGSLSDDATLPSRIDLEDSSSLGFRLILAKLIPTLTNSFILIGADCGEFVHEESQTVLQS